MTTSATDRQGGTSSGTASTDQRRGVLSSIAVKNPCVVATTANITLSGTQTIDGVAVVADDRVLVKDQTDGTENGIYIASASSWSRAGDWDGPYDISTGTLIYVTSGSTGQGFWKVTTTGTITIGTTSVAFSGIQPLNISSFWTTMLAYTTAGASLTGLGVSSFVQTLLDDADADTLWATIMATITKATARTGLGVAIGSDVQAYDATLAALAGVGTAANKIPYFTAADTAGELDFKDEDAMTSNSATALASQQSIKTYVDALIAALPVTVVTQATDSSDNSLSAGDNDGPSMGTQTLPTKGLIILGCSTKITDTSATANRFGWGIKISSSYYYNSFDDNGTTVSGSDSATCNLQMPGSEYRTIESPDFDTSSNTTGATLAVINIEESGIPTGSQDITFAIDAVGAATMNQTSVTGRYYMIIIDFT